MQNKRPRGSKRLRASSSKFTTYSNLAKNQGKSKRAIKKDRKARAHAAYLATLPKNPVKRFFARLHPKRLAEFWFSMDGLKMLGKIFAGFLALLLVICVIAFFYFRHELASLQPSELAKRVQTTVTKYYDRNDQLLWEDAGSGEYRLVINSDQISKYMKDATVAIEDKSFYQHGGVSFTGTIRAILNNIFRSGGTQGGSTLTQQLVKQVFFEEEAENRGISGIPRKIKEAILSIEAERIYSKDQILTMYLNESPYGGRRNGVESAAQTYFGKPAKDLDLAEASLLASIPQSPSLYNPYNIDGHTALLKRQHVVLDYMVKQGFVSSHEAAEAKKAAVLDRVKPLENQLSGAKAPHFIQMVKDNLTNRLGSKIMGQGGLTIKTTLDIRVQEALEGEMDALFNGRFSYLPRSFGFDNASFTMVDNQTGQILGVIGSRSYNHPDYGAVNSAISFIQPGSSVKPLVYAALINNQDNPNGTFGAGSIIPDTPIPQSIYKTSDGTSVNNADRSFRGNISIRQSLGGSRNVPAIKAMSLNGVEPTINFIRESGDKSYCTDGSDKNAGLSSALGSCGAKQIEHANAFATLARGGIYKPVSDVIEVKNSQKETLYAWKDSNNRVMDEQTSYIISDILTDDSARQATFGWRPSGFYVPGIKTATKTGTSNIGAYSKDLWMMSYTPKATLAVWAGNHVPAALRGGDGMQLGPVVSSITSNIYNNIFRKDGSWKPGDWFKRPNGIQNLRINGYNDIYPSWFNKNKKTSEVVKMVFDKSSKKLATNCTPDAAKETLDAIKTVDPVTKTSTLTPPQGYSVNAYDDYHSCGDSRPFVSVITSTPLGGGKYTISVIAKSGTHPITGASISVGGSTYDAHASNGAFEITVAGISGDQSVSAVVTDEGYYTGELTQTIKFGDKNTAKDEDKKPKN